MIDYHIHTILCNHASGSMEQYIQAAVRKGLSEICFLDHLTLNARGRHLSMTIDDLPLYFHAIRRFALQYRNDIHIKAGLEIDFDPKTKDRIADIIGPFAFDVIGGSVHFIDYVNLVSTIGTQARENMKIHTIVNRYLDHLDQLCECDWVDIICHLDVPKKFGRYIPAGFEDKFDAILSKINRNNLTVELNTSGLNHAAKETYPNLNILRKCLLKNIAVTIGSDAHHPENVGQHYGEALDLLQAAGYRNISVFTRRNRYHLPINHCHSKDQQLSHGGII